MANDETIIEISDEDLEAVESDVLIIEETDLLTRPTSVDLKNWNPQASATKTAVDIVLLIDTSGSMGADDYKPNRLIAAKEAAKLFTKRKVTQNYNDRVAVIGFGGRAKVYHPLDSQLDKVAIAIDRIKMTHSGTMVGTALLAAWQELKQYQGRRQAIVLLSDGGDKYDTSNPMKVVGNLRDIKVFTIGIGTLKGGQAKLPHGWQQVHLNEKILQQIAQASGGQYVYAPDVLQLQKIYMNLADY